MMEVEGLRSASYCFHLLKVNAVYAVEVVADVCVDCGVV